VALADEEFSTVAQGAVEGMAASSLLITYARGVLLSRSC